MSNFSWIDCVHCQGECNGFGCELVDDLIPELVVYKHRKWSVVSRHLVSVRIFPSDLAACAIVHCAGPETDRIAQQWQMRRSVTFSYYYFDDVGEMARTEFWIGRNKMASDNLYIKWHSDSHRLTLQANSTERQLFQFPPTDNVPNSIKSSKWNLLSSIDLLLMQIGQMFCILGCARGAIEPAHSFSHNIGMATKLK